MKYTRLKQLEKVNKCKCNKSIGNLKISDVREILYGGKLDKTFKWHRDFEDWKENWIELGGDEYEYGVCIHVRGSLGSYKFGKRGVE